MAPDDGSTVQRPESDSLPFIRRPEYYQAVLQRFDVSTGEVASLTDLVASLTAQDALPDDRDRIALVLHHIVLPKLAGSGVIEYDARNHTIRYRGRAPVEQVFRSVPSHV